MNRLPLSLLTAPFETCLCFVLAVANGYALVTVQPPGAALATLPVPLWRAYEVVTFLGALLVVIAALWPHPRNLAPSETLGRVEAAGLWMLFASFTTFAIVIVDLVGKTAWLATGTYVALAAACLLRIYAIRRLRLILQQHE